MDLKNWKYCISDHLKFIGKLFGDYNKNELDNNENGGLK